MRVLKYQFPPKSEIVVPLPEGATILHVGEQDGMITLWAFADSTRTPEHRLFRIYGTGHAVAESAENHVATIQMRDGFVWHLFERTS